MDLSPIWLLPGSNLLLSGAEAGRLPQRLQLDVNVLLGKCSSGGRSVWCCRIPEPSVSPTRISRECWWSRDNMTLICSAAEGGTVSVLQMHIDLPFLFDPLSLLITLWEKFRVSSYKASCRQDCFKMSPGKIQGGYSAAFSLYVDPFNQV